MISCRLPPTTHTLEMAQVAELNDRLSGASGAITAAAVGMGGARLHPPDAAGLPAAAVLTRLSWRGSPEFPDIYGHFGAGDGRAFQALLHTAALKRLARHLRVRQCWGIGLPPGSASL